MPDVKISTWSNSTPLDETGIIDLYNSVGWTAYTDHLDSLFEGLRKSLRVVLAHRDGQLVGLARIIGDGATICYLQDVLVHPDARRQGLGQALVHMAFAPYEGVRQHVLITDEEPGQKAFYEAIGFTQLGAATPGRAFVRFNP
ncbi:GNAT family N-acetyltransferase [Luteococcus sp. OSA5]|uniref:GNAT family N-acetyltransferase n=1 Tax=unclassified Luteococcus TaxID=2639923 RepID=UPI003B437C48